MTYTLTPNCIPEPMTLHGLLPSLRRMPEEIAETVSEAVHNLVKCPSGARLRFKTNSSSIALRGIFREANVNCAADVLCDGELVGKVGPFGCDFEVDSIEGTLPLPGDGEMHSIIVYLPRTVELLSFSVTLDDGATVAHADDYKIKKPIVFYGSSITMGAMACSPSRAYTARVAERLGADHMNLGFGGSAKGEPAMSDYIASLGMSAFVLDYEHNAPTLEHLKATHKPFFDKIRAAHPTLPILIVSRPDTDGDPLRAYGGRRIIIDTFHSALDAGDVMVDYIDGFYLWGNDNRHLCHAEDGCHPNDEGFRRMADVIAPRLERLMRRSAALTSTEEDGSDDRFKKRL